MVHSSNKFCTNMGKSGLVQLSTFQRTLMVLTKLDTVQNLIFLFTSWYQIFAHKMVYFGIANYVGPVKRPDEGLVITLLLCSYMTACSILLYRSIREVHFSNLLKWMVLTGILILYHVTNLAFFLQLPRLIITSKAIAILTFNLPFKILLFILAFVFIKYIVSWEPNPNSKEKKSSQPDEIISDKNCIQLRNL